MESQIDWVGIDRKFHCGMTHADKITTLLRHFSDQGAIS